MLALAGATYQGVFRNPLADPYLLGVAAGAGLGATIAFVYGVGGAARPGCRSAAFVGGAVAVALAYVVGRSAGRGPRGGDAGPRGSRRSRRSSPRSQTFVQQQHSDTLQQVYSWILGWLDDAGWHGRGSLLPYAVIATRRDPPAPPVLDVLSVGDDEAASLGVNVRRVRLCSSLRDLGTAAAVAVSGLIGFVGIIVPHSIRLVVGPSYRLLLPLSVLVGGGLPRARGRARAHRRSRRPSCRSASSPRSSARRSSPSCCARSQADGLV